MVAITTRLPANTNTVMITKSHIYRIRIIWSMMEVKRSTVCVKGLMGDVALDISVGGGETNTM